MAKKDDSQKTGEDTAGAQGTGPDDNQVLANEEMTVEDLKSTYPQLVTALEEEQRQKLVTAIEDELLDKIGQCTAKQIKANMPELYERIVIELQGRGGPNLNVPGFLLEFDDPFARGTLEQYGIMKKLDGLSLPYVLPFNVKGQAEVNVEQLTNKYEASKALKGEFKNVDAYIAFKRKIVTQVLEFYILIAEGGGDYKRANNARRAMRKIK